MSMPMPEKGKPQQQHQQSTAKPGSMPPKPNPMPMKPGASPAKPGPGAPMPPKKK